MSTPRHPVLLRETPKGLAKAGDEITEKARRALALVLERTAPLEQRGKIFDELATTVAPQGEGADGAWFCITCGSLPNNNPAAAGHRDRYASHRMAWRNFSTGLVEEP